MQASLEEFSMVAAAIHAAAAHPERWPEALSTVAHLMNGSHATGDRTREWQPVLASLDRLGVTAFILDVDGVVHEMNECANKLLSSDLSAGIRNTRLRFSEPALNATFQAALRKAAHTPPRSSVFPLRSAANDIHEVTVSPLQPANDGSWAGALALVVIARPRPGADHIARRMRRLHGLTHAEARVSAALTLGETVGQIAAAYGVRVSTVRAQIRSIFEKTGVHRQSDLVRLALTGAPPLTSLQALGPARAIPPRRFTS